MSHPSVLSFFSHVLGCLAGSVTDGPRVLEIGSYDVNGSIRGVVKSLVEPAEYIGVDLTPGPGVDVVCSGHELDLPSASFDLSISAECLEHNPHYEATLKNLRRMTCDKGYTIISCATTGRLEHRTTRTNPTSSPGTQAQGWDYYKNLTPKNFPKEFIESYADHVFFTNPYSCDLYFIGSVTGLLPDILHQPPACVTMRPKYSFVNYFTLALPLEIIRNIFSEESYQNIGVSYLRIRIRLRKALENYMIRGLK